MQLLSVSRGIPQAYSPPLSGSFPQPQLAPALIYSSSSSITHFISTSNAFMY
jgi:hypothetical protein